MMGEIVESCCGSLPKSKGVQLHLLLENREPIYLKLAHSRWF